MTQEAGGELALELIVHRERVDIRVAVTADAGVAAGGLVGIAGAVEDLFLVVLIGVTQVLPERQVVVEVVRELVAGGRDLSVEGVEARHACEERHRDGAPVVRPQRARGRQELEPPPGPVALVVGEDRDGRVLVRLEGNGGRDEDAIVLGEVDLGLAVADDAGQAPQHGAFLVGGAAHVELALIAVEAAAGDRDFAELLRRRQLCHVVEQAAGAAAAIHCRGRSLEDLETFGAVGVEAVEVHVIAGGNPEAVDVKARHGHVEAADLEAAEAGVRAAIDVAADACGVAQGLPDRDRALVSDLVGGDDGHRLRRFDQRRVGLGGGAAPRRHEAAHRPIGAFIRVAIR